MKKLLLTIKIIHRKSVQKSVLQLGIGEMTDTKWEKNSAETTRCFFDDRPGEDQINEEGRREIHISSGSPCP